MNKQLPGSDTKHGTQAQFLLEKILRDKIYTCRYWNEYCFGLSAETIIEKAVDLKFYGGTIGGAKRPTPFICLVLKMLQIQPSKEIIYEYIKQKDFRYIRILGAFYLRLIGKPLEIFEYLEPLLEDFRKLRIRKDNGYEIKHLDEAIDELLTTDYCCDVALPHLPKRSILEYQGLLTPRISKLEDELMESEINEPEEKMELETESKRKNEQNDRDGKSKRNPDPDRDRDRESDEKEVEAEERLVSSVIQTDQYQSVKKSKSNELEEESEEKNFDSKRDRHRDREKDRDRERDREREKRKENEKKSNNSNDKKRPREDSKKEKWMLDKPYKKQNTKNNERKEPTEEDEIESMNKVRASLGLPPLKR